MVINRFTAGLLPGVLFTALTIALCLPSYASAVGCYVCDSTNSSDPACHDPFHPTNNTYVDDCMDGKPGIVGLFPTRYCIKMSGYRWSTELLDYTYLYVRRCAVESLGHASGTFVWGGYTYTGSILTCDYDGCNAASRNYYCLRSAEAFVVLLTSATVFLLGCTSGTRA